ncbi:MAG: hypothetical protein ACFB21_12980, partial [Opitutales bacterium]
MSDLPDEPTKGSEEDPSLDLTALQGINFGPDWSDRTQSSISTGPDRGERRPGKGGRREGPPQNRDRRPPSREGRAGGERPRERSSEPPRGRRPDTDRPQRAEGRSDRSRDREDRPPRGGDRSGRADSGERRPRQGGREGGPRGNRRDSAPPKAPFKPVIEVLIYPDDMAFKALCTAMRNNCRTYELFEIARLILEKPERHVLSLKPKPELEQSPKAFYVSVPDGLPFESEAAAIQHAVGEHLETFVDVEEIEVDPPKGNFPVIHKCGVTGELIGPPNYHRYQALLQEHHATRIATMPFERFQSKLESLKDPEAVQQWTEKMSKQKRYKLKEPEEDAPESFDNPESVRFHLSTRRKAALVRETDQLRLPGKAVEKLPHGVIRDSIEAELDYQKRFPLITANNLRGRLRRLKFTIYKKGSKGVSFVCAVKRKFRDGQKQFSESIQELLDFLDAHPYMPVGELPEQFLGITPSKRESEPQEKAPELTKVSADEAAKIVEVHELKRAQRKAGETAEGPEGEARETTEASEEAATAASTTETPTAEAPEGTASAEAAAEPEGDPAPTVEATSVEMPSTATPTGPVKAGPEPGEIPAAKQPEGPREIDVNEQRLRSLMNSLRWLVTEGYVTEFGDGRLFANPPVEAPETGSATAGDASRAAPQVPDVPPEAPLGETEILPAESEVSEPESQPLSEAPIEATEETSAADLAEPTPTEAPTDAQLSVGPEVVNDAAVVSDESQTDVPPAPEPDLVHAADEADSGLNAESAATDTANPVAERDVLPLAGAETPEESSEESAATEEEKSQVNQ